MDISNALALAATIATLAYLLYALLRPERF
ncbi:potassium-transporting ATPase subunit F [Tsukamurella pulmonis]|uniref:K+-transporting ATPase, KdpF subunit n=1 Tax=Tsukamurella pulmonis TaxID=47312 RepID=A0A1H1H312_9ACTN|nr:potassium-transporting ATPase subunit F [Tsukamurella pulmonis]RDH09959.1 potassium-transporting ATPase subunit F [Tsukamurella pulmonis]SDR19784.1 K+-transporting ATPase, KdpF subunit [Tsukamurella pulmonis]SUP16077.1 potassium-transporting ATPase subunit F [Tsukamurella pulmonis]